MPSSSDSSDEDLTKFSEAIDREFINDDMFKVDEKKTSKERVITQLPSLRPDKIDNNDQQFNCLPKVTPEFRNYVAKQLSRILEKQLNEQLTRPDEHLEIEQTKIKRKKSKNGIKLFNDSKHFIKIPKYENIKLPIVDRKQISNYSDNDDDDDKFRSIAVNPDDILNHKEIKYWSKRSKAPVYRYKTTPTGLIEIKSNS